MSYVNLFLLKIVGLSDGLYIDILSCKISTTKGNLLHNLNMTRRVFVGTVSEFCVKHVECPVVTIKRSPDETPQDPVDD